MNVFGDGKVIPIRRGKNAQAARLVPLWAGCRIGNCRIEGMLDRSPVAITYHGRDQLLGRPVLIRECAPAGLVSRAPDGSLKRREGADARVHREILREFALRARALANSEHPALARVHSLLTHRDGAYLIMQSQAGLHLDQRVRSLGPLSPAAIRKLASSLVSALEYLHARDLVHRGIRPSHVRIGEDGGATLLDFGLALNSIGAPACNDLTRYSAPEEFAGQPNSAGPASDIYSLAATLFFAMSGLQPPASPQRVVALQATGMDPMRVLLRGVARQCPPGLARALAVSLSINPSARPASIAEWRALAEQRQPRVRPQARSGSSAGPGKPGSELRGRSRPRPRSALRWRSGLRWTALTGVVAGLLATLFWWGGIRMAPEVPLPSPGPETGRAAAAGSREVEAVRQRLVERLMRAAERDINELRLTRPAGDNAHEKLRRVLKLAPGHQPANQLLEGIADRYLELVRGARARGDLDAAEGFLARAGQVSPHHAGIATERRSLASARRARAQASTAREAPRPAAKTGSGRSVVAPQPKPAASAVAADRETLRIESASFMMGSSPQQRERGTDERLHPVSVQSYSLGRREVTVAEFKRFVEATGYVTDAERDAGGWPGCLVFAGGAQWEFQANTNWRQPGFRQSPQHPVVCVSFADASAYAQWLGEQSGLPYRLPTEAEWEYAARSDAPAPLSSGDTSSGEICRFANAADRSMARQLKQPLKNGQKCDDGSAYTAAVGSLDQRRRGLSDMLGNVWEWTCSDYDGAYGGAERRCADAFSGAQKAVRGGGWSDPPAQVRIANRGRLPGEYRYANLGFRVALDAR